MQLTLPESVFGLAIAEPIVLDRQADGNWIYFGEIFKAYVMLAMTYMVQVHFMRELKKVNDHKAGDGCDDESLHMQLLCTFVFVVAIFTEVRDAFKMILVIWEQPSSALEDANRGTFHRLVGHKPAPNGEHGGAILEKEDNSKKNRAMRMMHLKGEADVKQWSLHGISRFMKVWSIVAVCIPRLMASFFLAYVGSEYIIKSGSSEEMILNTMAVNFVLDIDEIFYNAFTSDHTKESFQNMEPVEVDVDNKRRTFGWLTSTFVYPSVVFFLPIWIVLATKARECDDYEKPFPRFVLMLEHMFGMAGHARQD